LPWRIIDDVPHDAFFNMALDEAISVAVRRDLSPPTLRLYQWSVPSVSIGYFQKTADINLAYCNKKAYPVVRRTTGGTAILHDSELTYSFSVRTDIEPFGGGLYQSYMAISNAVAGSLKRFNIDAEISTSRKRIRRNPSCFRTSSYGEITVQGRKIIGSAQRRHKNCLLQQGSILLGFNAGSSRNIVNNVSDENDCLETGFIWKYSPAVSVPDLKASLKDAFEDVFCRQLACTGISEFELKLAEELMAEKYATEKWNMRR
jgi:lipoate-protein ligase A